jgi:hypothetical protein
VQLHRDELEPRATLAQAACECLHRFGVAADDAGNRAFIETRLRDRRADAFRAARDQDNFVS